MMTKNIAFNLGLTSCYLIIGKETVMVDAGGQKKLQHFKKILTENLFRLKSLKINLNFKIKRI